MDEEKVAQKAMERAMGYVHQGGKQFSSEMKTNNMIEVVD